MKLGGDLSCLPGEEVSSIGLPVLNQELLHALVLDRQDLEPSQRGPDAVLLADVVGTGSGSRTRNLKITWKR